MQTELNQIIGELRLLSITDPRQARAQFCEILENDEGLLDAILVQIASPGDGRLRQLIANAVRDRPDKGKVVQHLTLWAKDETDEFSKRAIEVALQDVDVEKYKLPEVPLVDANLVDAYRYAYDRITHRFRNALLEPATYLLRLKRLTATGSDETLRDDLGALITQLNDAFNQVARIVEFDVEDEHFQWRSIQIGDWIRNMTAEYIREYRRINVTMTPGSAIIRANDHLLLTIFWNLWINAHQALPDDCRIHVRMNTEVADSRVKLLITDNGNGLPSSLYGVAFQERHSAHGASRGRGLLEVQSAVEQLKGTVQLVEVERQYRIEISLPLENP